MTCQSRNSRVIFLLEKTYVPTIENPAGITPFRTAGKLRDSRDFLLSGGDMGIVIKHCFCGRLLTTADIAEGRPCKACRERKKLDIPALEKKVRKPNPARNIWAEREMVGR